MNEANNPFKGTHNNDYSKKVDTAEGLSHLPLLSVVKDKDGIEAVRVWTVGAPCSRWLDDTGKDYELVLPVTILSTPRRTPKSS
jgi:hypothetical protein